MAGAESGGEDIGDQLAKHEHKLAEVQRALVALDQTEIETRWVVESLVHFDTVWDAMIMESRGRLVRAIVEKVEVDEQSGQVTAVLVDLDSEDDDPLSGPPPTSDIEKAEVRA